MLGFGLGEFGNIPFGGVYYEIDVYLQDNSVVEIGTGTIGPIGPEAERQLCEDSILQRLISRLPRVWRKAARISGRPSNNPNMLIDDWYYFDHTPLSGSNTNNILRLFAIKLCQYLADLKLALIELSILTADGYWLSLWGRYFNVKRFQDESDTAYRLRILSVLNNPKCTRRAILDRITPLLLEEPELIEYMYPPIPPYTNNPPFETLLPFNDIVNLERRRSRMELVLTALEPSDRVFYVDYSFIRISADEPALEAYEPYVFDDLVVSKFGGGFERVKEIVRKTKMAGVRVFYRTGLTYIG